MTESGEFAVSRVITPRAGLISIPTNLRTGGCLRCMFDLIMSEGFHIIVQTDVAAVTAAIGRVTLFRTGWLRYCCGNIVVDMDGGDRDREIPLDFRQAIAILNFRVSRQLQVFVGGFRQGCDAVKDIPGLQDHHKVDLTVSAAVDHAGVSVAGVRADCIRFPGTVGIFGFMDGYGYAFAAGYCSVQKYLAAHGTDVILIIVGKLGKRFRITVSANRTVIGCKPVS